MISGKYKNINKQVKTYETYAAYNNNNNNNVTITSKAPLTRQPIQGRRTQSFIQCMQQHEDKKWEVKCQQ